MHKLKKLNSSGIKPKHYTHLKRHSENLADYTRNLQFKNDSNITFHKKEQEEENLEIEEHNVKKPCPEHFAETGPAVRRQSRGQSHSLQSTAERYCICEADKPAKGKHSHRLSGVDESLTLFDTTENEESFVKLTDIFQSACGKYCRNLTAREQAKIIGDLLKLENNSPLRTNRKENRMSKEMVDAL